MSVCSPSPDDYPTSRQWNARLMIERSHAISCPSLSVHLAGTKKARLHAEMRRWRKKRGSRQNTRCIPSFRLAFYAMPQSAICARRFWPRVRS
eukprot:1896210-Pleurochrysis_carterae.AAC.1